MEKPRVRDLLRHWEKHSSVLHTVPLTIIFYKMAVVILVKKLMLVKNFLNVGEAVCW